MKVGNAVAVGVAGNDEVVYTNTPFNDGSSLDDIVIGSDIGAKWFPLEGYDILDYSGFDRGITISEFEGTVRVANGIIGQISAVQGVGFEEYRVTAFDDVVIAASGDAVEDRLRLRDSCPMRPWCNPLRMRGAIFR